MKQFNAVISWLGTNKLMNSEYFLYARHWESKEIMKISFIGKIKGFPAGTSLKEPACQCRRCRGYGIDPCFGKSPGVEHGSPLQNSCLESPLDREARQAKVHSVEKSQTRLTWLSMHTSVFLQKPTSAQVKSFLRPWAINILSSRVKTGQLNATFQAIKKCS